jgi:hypothetical protein
MAAVYGAKKAVDKAMDKIRKPPPPPGSSASDDGA